MERHIGDYHFIADPKTGMTARWGKTLDDNPKFSPVPELADISISNYCTKGCDFCYKNSSSMGNIMSLDSYCKVLDALEHPIYGNVFQVALGGGEPLEHPQFREIISETIYRNIIPNFTTNGIHLNKDLALYCKEKVGAVAISTDNMTNLNKRAINILLKAGIKTNIHYVLKNNNLYEAINIILGKYDKELEGVNAIIFLTFKPAGRGNNIYIIKEGFEYLDFLKAVKNKKSNIKIGFDACFVPNLLYYGICNTSVVDTCEGGFFSVYVDENCNVSPCSFSGKKDIYSLNDFDFYDIWLNKLKSFRERIVNNCKKQCAFKIDCKGYCPYYPQITTCYNEN